MSEKRCAKCNKIIVENWEKWRIENEHSNFLQCPYCFELEELKK